MRISYSIIACGIFFSIFSFYFENLIVVQSLQKRSIIEKKLKPHRVINTTKKNNIYYHLDEAFLSIKKYDYKKDMGHNISVQKYLGPDLTNRIDANTMEWNEKENYWILSDVEIRKWNKNILSYSTVNDSNLIIADITPEIIKQDFIDPEEMDYWELSSFINKLKNKGLSYNRWSVNKHFKTAFACAPLIMILFGIALSIQDPRSNLTSGIGTSILVIFLYYVLIKAGQSFGYNNILPPFISIWMVNILFFIFGTYLFIKSKT